MPSSTNMSNNSSDGHPPRIGLQDPNSSWTDDLPVCYLSGVGFSTNQIYREDGFRREEHEFEDRSFHFCFEGDIFMYGLFDGHDGSTTSNFAAQKLPAELLLDQLHTFSKLSNEEIKQCLHKAFLAVEKGFFEHIDDPLAQRTNLQLQLPEGINSFDAATKFPELVSKLQALDSEIAGGTTATVALIVSEKLYVANVGNTRALLCKTDAEGTLRVSQLTVDHTVQNEDELRRFANLGLDIDKIRHSRKLGNHEVYTRCIGDYSVKGGYKDIEILSPATSEPVIAEPQITDGIPLDTSPGFLILMSDGVYNSFRDATGKEHVNAEIASMVASEFGIQSTLNGVAQAVIDKVVRIHHDAFMTASNDVKQQCQKRDDMTLLVRNFSYPLPNAISSPTQGGLYNPVSVPYYQGRSNKPPSVNIPQQLTITAPSPVNAQAHYITRALFQLQSQKTELQYNTNSGTVTQSTLQTERSSAYTSTYTSSNDSTQSGEQNSLFMRNRSIHRSLELDAEGKIEPYVDFSQFYQAIEELTDSQRETLDADMKPQLTYETIKEEGESDICATPITDDDKSLEVKGKEIDEPSDGSTGNESENVSQ